MLNETIRARRKAKGLSQQELRQAECGAADRFQMEQGLSVPIRPMLIALSEALETPVSALLGETPEEGTEPEPLQAISEKLEVINLQLARQQTPEEGSPLAAHRPVARRLWPVMALAGAEQPLYTLGPYPTRKPPS